MYNCSLFQLWDKSDHSEHNNENTQTNMFTFENHWQSDGSWSMGNDDKSEHAISQPITMAGRRPEQYPGPLPQSVTSPTSADGQLGVHMVEYVLASSPGGHDLENRMKEMKLGNNMNNMVRYLSTYMSIKTSYIGLSRHCQTKVYV